MKLEHVKILYKNPQVDIERVVVFHEAKDLSEWREEVLKRWPMCFYIGCRKRSTDSHHILRREVQEFRMIVEAGIGGCNEHHMWLENLPRKKYWRFVRLLILRDYWEIFTSHNPF